MSSNNNNNNGKQVLKLRGFTSYGFQDKSRDTFSAVDVWDLEVEVIPKDKRFRNYVIFDYKDERVPAVGVNGQVIGIKKDQHYLDTELLFLPVRLIGKRFHNVPESEIDMLRDESKEEGVIWLDSIPGLAPVRELLEKANPRMEQATHIFVEDNEKTLNPKLMAIHALKT